MYLWGVGKIEFIEMIKDIWFWIPITVLIVLFFGEKLIRRIKSA
jgi:hypothetical protein